MPIDPPFETPPPDHPSLPELVNQLSSGSSAVAVPRHTVQMPFGNCYWNVDRMVSLNGGRDRLGWAVRLWPSRYLSAQHHAVWEDANGAVWDVTADYGPGLADHTVFVPDDRIRVDLKRVPNVMNRFLPLSRHKRVTEVIDAYKAKHAIEGQICALAYEAGYRCEAQFQIASGDASSAFELAGQQAKQYDAIDKKKREATRRLGEAITRLVEWRG